MKLRTPPRRGSVRPPDLHRRARAAARGGADPVRAGALAGLAELPVLVAAALLMAFLIKTFLVQAFYIPSGSMIPTLEVNDRVLVEKVTYRLRAPERGEVVVFRRPGIVPPTSSSPGDVVRSFLEGLGLVQPDGEIDLIKRVIGLPGETVAMIDGTVLVDGRALDEPYAQPETRDFAATEVPPGHLFMMGDNRTQSDDSRFSLGPVPVENVVGRAFVIVWPLARATLGLDRDYPDVGETAAGVPAAVGVLGAVIAGPSARRRAPPRGHGPPGRLTVPRGRGYPRLAASRRPLAVPPNPHSRRSRGPSIPPPETASP